MAQAEPANGRRRCAEKPEEKRAEGWATRLGPSPPVQLGVAEQILQLNSLDLVVVQVEFIQGLWEVCRDNECDECRRVWLLLCVCEVGEAR